MKRLSTISLIALMAMSLVEPAGADEQPLRFVMFGARWCGPCVLEYRELPLLAAEVRPDHIVLAWIDGEKAIPKGLEAAIMSTLPPLEAEALALKLAGEGYGLPMTAVMTADGKLCTLWRRRLHTGDIATLKSQCR